MSAGGSIVVRRSLGRRLRQLREKSGKKSADVIEAGIASRAKLARIESGHGPVRMPDVRALCWLYGVDAQTTELLVEQAMNTAEQGWWENYGDAMPSWFGMYVELESAASSLLTWDPELVHGLLQTPAYQRAVFETSPDLKPEYAERQLRLRSERQRAAFDRPKPLRLTAVIGEGTLMRQIGGPEGMAEQRNHLIEISARAHVDVWILGWSAGPHVAMKGAFSVLGFDSPDDPDVVYLETHAGGRYVEQSQMVEEYRRMFDAIRKVSIPIEEYK